MIALDTNVLVRYLVEDDEKQSALAAALIARVVANDDALFVSDVVVSETVWVLSVSYDVARKEIAVLLRNLYSRAPPRLRGPRSADQGPRRLRSGQGRLRRLSHSRACPCGRLRARGDVRSRPAARRGIRGGSLSGSRKELRGRDYRITPVQNTT